MKIPFRSNFERKVAEGLTAANIEWKYEASTIPFYSSVRGGKCNACQSKDVAKKRRYLADFTVGTVHLEAKGKLDSPGRTKLMDIKRSNPGIDLRLIFMRDNKLKRDSINTYSTWATINGFKWCIGPEIPINWKKELSNAAIEEVPQPDRGGLPRGSAPRISGTRKRAIDTKRRTNLGASKRKLAEGS
jgi:hypothetical protein